MIDKQLYEINKLQELEGKLGLIVTIKNKWRIGLRNGGADKRNSLQRHSFIR
jgi:hypothetical protein